MFHPQATPVQTASQLSAHLKSLRKARGMTQAELGQRIGVKQVRVADIERNPGAISVEQFLEIIHALDARVWLGKAVPYAAPSPKPPVGAKEPGPSW
jgi:HTH-type transcriptional regulator / antitoxin HipB